MSAAKEKIGRSTAFKEARSVLTDVDGSMNDYGVSSAPSWITTETTGSTVKSQRSVRSPGRKSRSPSSTGHSISPASRRSRKDVGKSVPLSPENAILLKEDARLLASRQETQRLQGSLSAKADSARKKKPAPPPTDRAPKPTDPAGATPITARLAERKEARDAKRTVAPMTAVEVDGGVMTTAPVHPDDPLPTCIKIEPRSQLLVEEIIVHVAYIHEKLGFRNELLSIPATKTVAELGDILREYTGIHEARFMYTPNGNDHDKALHVDVAHHARRVELDDEIKSVKHWGLKNDDAFTVKGVHVHVPKPSREHLITVKTGAWRSDAPRSPQHKPIFSPVILAEPSRGSVASSVHTGTTLSTITATSSVDSATTTGTAHTSGVPSATGKVKLSTALQAKERKSRWETS